MEKSVIIEGMTCQSCVQKATTALEDIDGIDATEIKFGPEESTLHLSKEVSDELIKTALEDVGYSISSATDDNDIKSLSPYLPLFLSFAFLFTHALFLTLRYENDMVFFMHVFMGGFFLLFSFFKFLDIMAFANSFSTYDILAKRSKFYAYLYPFIELLLGFFYIGFLFPQFTYITTILIMGLGLIGVWSAVFSKQQIRCACMGAVFDLPMSTLTIIENGLMIVMAIILLVK